MEKSYEFSGVIYAGSQIETNYPAIPYITW